MAVILSMTKREEEILGWIEEDPLISQQELAKRANITRSSVGVHISNLMKKGLIQGKGYIVNKEPYITVLGGVNIDIFGYPNKALISKDSNPGKVRSSLGGVGRNIAHCLKLLCQNVKLITAFGEDSASQDIKKNCIDMSIDVTNSIVVQNGVTSTYMFITNNDGEMELAISDMEIYKNITPSFISTKMEIINRSALCILDTNLPKETIEFIAKNCKCPIFVDTVSITKAEKIESVLDKIHTMKPNKNEAEYLTGIKIEDMSTLKEAGNRLLDMGLKQVFISLSEEGVYCTDGQSSGLIPALSDKVVNTTGAGDSFMAAIAWAYRKNYSVIDMAYAGSACSAICVQSHETISPQTSQDRVLELIEQAKHKASVF